MTKTPWKTCERQDCRIIESPFVVSTMMGWEPTYDKEGRPIGVDPNRREARFRCSSCGRNWTRVSQAGKVEWVKEGHHDRSAQM